MLKLTVDQIAILSAPIPQNALKDVKGRGMTLTTINNYFIIERLNEAFGVGEWGWDVEVVDVSSFQVIVKGTITLPNATTLSQFGGASFQPKGGDFEGTDVRSIDKGDLYKGAATNALSKISSYLGIGGEIYGQKYKGKTTPPRNSQTTQQPKPQPKKEIVNVGDDVKESRVFAMVEGVKKDNRGKVVLYGKDKNQLFTNTHKFILSPKQVKTAIKYGAISS